MPFDLYVMNWTFGDAFLCATANLKYFIWYNYNVATQIKAAFHFPEVGPVKFSPSPEHSFSCYANNQTRPLRNLRLSIWM